MAIYNRSLNQSLEAKADSIMQVTVRAVFLFFQAFSVQKKEPGFVVCRLIPFMLLPVTSFR